MSLRAASDQMLNESDAQINGIYRSRIIHPSGEIMQYTTPTIPLAQIPEWIGGPVEKIHVVYRDKLKQCYILRDNIVQMDRLEYNEQVTLGWAEALKRAGGLIKPMRIYGIGVVCYDYSVTQVEPWDLATYRSRYPHGVEVDH